jgi:uncharacterized membrane protein
MSNPIVITALTAIVAVGLATSTTSFADQTSKSPAPAKMAKGLEKCYGIAKAGMNDCANGSNSCAGSATTDGVKDAWLFLPKGTCNKIVGGTIVPPKS